MKWNRYIGLLIVLFLSVQNVNAQEGDDWRTYNPNRTKSLPDSTVVTYGTQVHEPGMINIIADPRIKSLDLKKEENPTKLDGYRVQIFFGDRNKAQEMRGDFIRKYPNEKAYISYLAPNFRLRVGDFRTRIECEKFKHEISRTFQGGYIVKDKIELPALWEESVAAGQ